ncbi:MAG: glycosyltransferase family 39 protein [Thiohalocapsa sp.]
MTRGTLNHSNAFAPNWPIAGRIILVGFFLLLVALTLRRLFGLDQLFLWHDEVYTLVRVFGHPVEQGWAALFSGTIRTPDEMLALQRPDPSQGLASTWHALIGHPEHAPLYYLLGWLATRLPLDPVLALRGTAALFGILVPAAAYWLMRELFGRGPVPWVAAMLIACSPLHLLYAQEARQYSLWLLLVLASSAALVRALRELRTGDWWLYGMLLTVGLYTHLLFALMLPVHAAYGWLCARRRAGSTRDHRQDLPLLPWLLAAVGALILFLPWGIVVLLGLERTVDFTAWMSRPAGASANLLAWGHSLVRGVVDLWPDEPPAGSLLLLMPLAAALVYYLRFAPTPARWFLPLTALAYVAVVLGPDLLFGGVRSQHGRYGLPAILAAQLMTAWTLGSTLTKRGRARAAASLGLAGLIGLGLASQLRIGEAETWWNKNPNLSAQSPDAVQILNRQQRPFLAVGASDLSLGQLLSVARALDDRVRILGVRRDTPPSALPADLEQLVLLIPSKSLLAVLGPRFIVEPLGDGKMWAVATAARD